MLDLNFVRDNLPRVEEMLRQRGADPAAVLKDFLAVDTQRRQAITEAETMKARRNKASEDIAKLKKAGQDATAAIAETKELREQIQILEKTAADLDARLQEILSGIPNLPHESVPLGHGPEGNVEIRQWGPPPSSPGRALRFTGTWAQSSNELWRISCLTCTPASMDIPKFCHPTWLIPNPCTAPGSYPSLPTTRFAFPMEKKISG